MSGDAAGDQNRGFRSATGRSRFALAALLAVGGVAHFVVPEPYSRMIPRALPQPRMWVFASGVAELAVAALLVPARTARAAAWSAAALFVAIFPGNVQMALDGGIPGETGALGSPAVAWARLPLQIPLIVWAVRLARRRT